MAALHFRPVSDTFISESELAGLLARWQAITLAERQEIERENWPGLNGQQAAKQELMPILTSALEAWRGQFTNGEMAAQAQRQKFRALVDELLSCERQNQEALRTRQTRVKAGLSLLDQSSRTLQGVQKAYGAPTTEAWRTYS